ncbi:RmlC-like cupin domain-containing protein [Phaeosphaeria sp. MPI-PUGE-AT-0046c]|nr:RmlC-like cupin domain-containing protein [Phaeosphaeria sp. MPI-PUGE-AT-0046c]
MATNSKHVISLENVKPFFESENGSMRKVTAEEMPILKNLSIKRLELGPKAIREPHWHVNANEMGYVLEGSLLVNILDSGSEFSAFTASQGQMFHIESGSLHYLENLSDSERAVVIICFRHELPEDFSLHASFGAMSNAVLGNTYGLKSAELERLSHDTTTKYIVKRKGSADVPRSAHFENPHKFDIEKMSPPVSIDVGSARTARSQFWPALKNMAMYSLTVEEDGMREPHWHPKTGELGFVHKGHARMSIMDPDGSVDTYTLKPGDMYFVPAAYPHQIEVLGDERIHFLIFFDQPMPYDVGYKASATAISKAVMAATFGVDEDVLPEFPTTVKDPLIVGRVNSLDPVVQVTA